jgi:glutathione S-transferase
MKLFCDPISTTSRPVLMFIADHALDVEIVHVDLMSGGHKDPAYLALNPNGIVPFLTDGEFGLGESAAILKYLAVMADCDAYPQDIYGQARVDEALSWFNTQFHEYFCLFTCYPHIGIPAGLSPELSAGILAYGREHAPRWLKVLDQHMLAGRKYVCGDEASIADYLGISFVQLGRIADYDFCAYPNIRAWIGRMKARPGYAPTFAAVDQMVAFLEAQRQAAA